MIRKEKGITLIALVVTIVVLLILAGVSISLVLGDNGIISKAKDARDKYAQAEENDQAMLDEVGDFMYEIMGEEVPLGKVTVNEKANKNSTINGQAPSANNPIIPEGYIPINTDTSWGDGTTAPTQEAVDHGLVIKDDSENEWVWVPVDATTLARMYSTAGAPITLTGGTNSDGTGLLDLKMNDNPVTVSKYSTEIINGKTRVQPNDTTSFREPDLVVGTGKKYDAVPQNRADAGFTKQEGETTRTMTLAEMAEAMVKNYEDMIASIGKYKGFYVGRYELSSAGEQKNQPTLTNTNWYDLYKKCTELKASDKVKTEMIWGCQWDVVCNWITSTNIDKSITNSSNWGNYRDYNTANNYTEGNEKYEAGAGSKQNTGSSENWRANNLYDIAGNCREWTQEAVSDIYRAGRGGYYSSSGSVNPASDRYSSVSPDRSDCDYIGSRSTLMVK